MQILLLLMPAYFLILLAIVSPFWLRKVRQSNKTDGSKILNIISLNLIFLALVPSLTFFIDFGDSSSAWMTGQGFIILLAIPTFLLSLMFNLLFINKKDISTLNNDQTKKGHNWKFWFIIFLLILLLGFLSMFFGIL
ncbi:MAG: hypothetical protein AAB821_01625 [Patescibacteria group bacterium]